MQPLTSTPKKSPASPILLLKEPSFDEDNFAVVTFSDDDNESSFQISFEDLEETIERDVDQSTGDDESFENMCSVPKYIVFEDKPLKLFNRSSACGGEDFEKDVVKRGSALKVTALCINSPSQEWVSAQREKGSRRKSLTFSGNSIHGKNVFSCVRDGFLYQSCVSW